MEEIANNNNNNKENDDKEIANVSITVKGMKNITNHYTKKLLFFVTFIQSESSVLHFNIIWEFVIRMRNLGNLVLVWI